MRCPVQHHNGLESSKIGLKPTAALDGRHRKGIARALMRESYYSARRATITTLIVFIHDYGDYLELSRPGNSQRRQLCGMA